jgi:hypothetical protein
MKNILRRNKKEPKVDQEPQKQIIEGVENFNSNEGDETNRLKELESNQERPENIENNILQNNQNQNFNNQGQSQGNLQNNQPVEVEMQKLNPSGNVENNLQNNENQNLLNPNVVKPKEENKIQTEFKNIFSGRDFFSNNTFRKRLMHFTFACIIVDILFLQILW